MTKKTFSLMLVLLLPVFIAGCGGGSDSSSNGMESEVINNQPVPAEPDPVENAATIAGVDINENGIRDDVERVIATEFGGDDVEYEEARNFAVLEQNLLTINSEDAKHQYVEFIKKMTVCNLSINKELNKITDISIENKARNKIYRDSLAGTHVSMEGMTCP